MKLLNRVWRSIAPKSTSSSPLRLLTFNMLADGLAQNGEFVKTPPEYLAWEYRKSLILQQIESSAADVVALQELNHADEIQSTLAAWGYDGMWLPKTASPALQYGAPSDGCGLYWRKSRLEVVHPPQGTYFMKTNASVSVDSSLDMPSNGGAVQGSSGFIYVTLRDRLLQAEQQTSSSPSSTAAPSHDAAGTFIVCTSHLKAKDSPENNLVRLDQARQIATQLQTFISNTFPATQPAVPVIVCGDFNTEQASQPIQHLLQHPVFRFQSIWDRETWGDAGAGGETTSFDVPWAKGMFSTWKFRPAREGEPATPEGLKQTLRTIDFILVGDTRGKLSPVEFLSMPTQAVIGEGGLPCSQYPSDHVAVGVGFEWTNV